jgi:hypothetical protein
MRMDKKVSLDNAYLLTKIVAGVMAIVGVVLAGLWKWCPRIKNIFEGNKTITLVNDDTGYTNFWHVGSQAGKPLLQIGCRFMVTNITDHSVALAQATWKGAIRGEIVTSLVSVKDLMSPYFGKYDIPPRARTTVGIDFMILTKKLPKVGRAIKLNIGIIDQFGKKHWIKGVVFRSS